MTETQTGKGGGTSAAFARVIGALCTGSAAAAGIVALGISGMVVVSVVSRWLGLGSVRGDFELVQLGCGVTAFLFMPFCQLQRGHIAVDLFTDWLPPRAIDRLAAFWELVFALCWAVLAWRMVYGLESIRGYGDRSMMLQIPLWMIYVPAIFGAALSGVVAVQNAVGLWRGHDPDRRGTPPVAA